MTARHRAGTGLADIAHRAGASGSSNGLRSRLRRPGASRSATTEGEGVYRLDISGIAPTPMTE